MRAAYKPSDKAMIAELPDLGVEILYEETSDLIP